jgi:hypothetical protein
MNQSDSILSLSSVSVLSSIWSLSLISLLAFSSTRDSSRAATRVFVSRRCSVVNAVWSLQEKTTKGVHPSLTWIGSLGISPE